MRADICEPQDAATIARFKAVLRSLGAELLDHHDSALGVDLWRYRVGEAILSVFADSWSVDLEGPAEFVQQVVAAVQEGRA
jgi:hypothetical protein